MEVRKITEYPEKVLATVGKPVMDFDEELENLCADMFETMYEAEGVGLAAQQIGLALRLFVMDCEGIKLVAANPEIIQTEGEQSGQEGCLSVGKVPAVVVRGEKATCERRTPKANGLNAKRRVTRHVVSSTKPTIATANFSLTICRKLRRDMVVKRF